MNNNNIFPLKSNRLSLRSKQASQQGRKYRYSPHTSAIFAYDHQIRSTQTDMHKMLSPQNMGIFSINNCGFQDRKYSKDVLQNTKISSFNIKKIIDRSLKKKFEAQTQKQEQATLTHHRELNRLLVKQYWQRFIHSSSPANDPDQEIININKDMGLVVNRTKQNKSQLRNRNFKNQTSRRTTFYVNNFKTRYRRQKIESPPIKKEMSLREKPLIEKVVKQIHLFGDNEVIPWEKANNIEEQSFIGF